MLPVLGSLLGAAGTAASSAAADKQRQEDLMRNAIETKYSAWLAPQKMEVSQGGGGLGAVAGGALTGGMMGAELAGKLPGAPAAEAAAPVSKPVDIQQAANEMAGSSAMGLGGGVMSGQQAQSLGNIGQNLLAQGNAGRAAGGMVGGMLPQQQQLAMLGSPYMPPRRAGTITGNA